MQECIKEIEGRGHGGGTLKEECTRKPKRREATVVMRFKGCIGTRHNGGGEADSDDPIIPYVFPDCLLRCFLLLEKTTCSVLWPVD
ncbi:hypothetical protein D5086_006052 [Populus alba]|uniref:Uncharacterized protein n=1 Tax=Populus alba TaxID=43335 RepID=A0ACC4CKS9_POPAL